MQVAGGISMRFSSYAKNLLFFDVTTAAFGRAVEYRCAHVEWYLTT
jgi:hypothetical protein